MACIERCDAHFPEGVNYCEDVCFNVQLLKHDIKVSYLNKAFYHYVQNQTSLTNLFTLETLNTQKRYVAFLIRHLPEDSFPVIRSKELVKKLAYRSGVLSDKDFNALYPEIKKVHGEDVLVEVMYSLAFNGHNRIANLLRNAYWLILKKRSI